MKDKTVLVTGHTGFKGGWLCEWLLHLGADVHGVALSPSDPSIFSELRLGERIASDQRIDIRDGAAVKKVVQDIQPDFVFHLAAQPLVRFSYEVPVETFETNVNGTIHVMEALRGLERPCVAVLASTDKVYQNQEWIFSYRENEAMGGEDPYSASKSASELAVASWRSAYFGEDSPITIATVRAGNVIGGGDWAKDRIVPDCIRALQAQQPIPVRNRSSTRPWQHVLEPLDGYLRLAETLANSDLDFRSKEEMSRGINFGPALPSNRTVAELVEEFLKHIPGAWEDASPSNPPYEAGRLNLAIDKAYHLLNWYPVWDFSQTVEKTAQWYLAWMENHDVQDLTKQQIKEYEEASNAPRLAD